jgi:hypothetical protein
MRRKLALGSIAALVVAATGVTAVAATHSTTPAGTEGARSEELVRLVAKEIASDYLDLGHADFSIGDQIPFTNDLYRDGSKVGKDGGWCVVARIAASGASTFECLGTNSLPGGQVTVQGLVTYGPTEEVKADPYSFAITGGTGQYRGARGEVTIQEVSAVKFHLTFRIVLG